MESVEACMSSLKRAARLLMSRPLVNPADTLEHAIRSMDAGLFLIRHLLILKEQVAAFDNDLPGDSWDQAEQIRVVRLIRHSQARRNESIDNELSIASEVLIVSMVAWLSRPLAAISAQCVDQAAASRLREISQIFSSHLRVSIPLVAAHFQAYLVDPPGASYPQDGNAAPSILFAPIHKQLVAFWHRVTSQYGCSSVAPSIVGSVPSADEIRRLMDELFEGALGMPWMQLMEAVARAPRSQATFASESVPHGTSFGEAEGQSARQGGEQLGLESQGVRDTSTCEPQVTYASGSTADPSVL